MGKIDLVIVVPFVRFDRELVGTRLANQLEDVTHVEFALDKFILQIVQEFRIGSGIPCPDIVDWLDDSNSKQVSPKPVDVTPGKILVVRGSHPGSQFFPSRCVLGNFMLRRIRKGRSRNLTRTLMLHFARLDVLDELIKRFASFDGGFSNFAFARCGILFQLELGEVRRHFVVLILGPPFEGVVVTFVAVEPGRQKEMSRILHRLGRFAENLVVGSGRIFLVRTAGRENLAGKGVVGRIVFYLLLNPFPQHLGADRTEKLPVDLQKVGPLVRPMLDKVRTADQLVHKLITLHPGRTLVVKKRAHGFRCRRKTGQIQGNPAKKLQIGAKIRGKNLHAFPLARGKPVDLVVCRRFFPGKPRTVTHDSQRRGRITPLVASQNRSLASSQGRHKSAFVVLGNFPVATGHNRLAGNVATDSVRIGGDYPDLLSGTNLLNDRVLWKKLDRFDSRNA